MASAEPGFGGVIGWTIEESTPWWPQPVAAPKGAPNVVFVVLDDVGFADLGCYGSEIETPHMDRLAAGGLRYTNFHTTAMCSPTRAALLTGRQPHSVGMGIIAEWSTGFPAYRGFVSPRAANLAEILGEHGYNSFAVGKWHLMSMADVTAAGPFTHWPLRRGFDRWYGFHGALADSWNPELYEDNHAIDPPRFSPVAAPLATPSRDAGDAGEASPTPTGPDQSSTRPVGASLAAPETYHLSEDLVDRAIGFIRDQQSVTPEKPFFLYLAFGAAHWPHQVPRAYVEKYRGQYDQGWDAVRERRLARQVELGIVPPGTELAPRNPGVQAWDDLSADERRLFARMQEVYAGFVDHTDAQVGRLVAYLDALGKLEDTLIVLLSDNGASPEGGPVGAVNARKHLQYEPETLEENLAAIDRLGDETTYGHYPMGWAQASNTPLKWYKKDVHAGGARDPLIVHWPARIEDGGTLRHQFHHVVDLTPTVLELLGIEAPATYRGEPQLPIHGTSLAYTFAAPEAPTRKQAQYFELLGDRGLWHDGWKVVARHEKGSDFERDRWELYHLDRDFSECRDLAAEQPEKLREMVQRWWTEAGTYGVLPLDDREYERVAASVAARARERYVYYPGMARIDRFSAPDITDRSYTITAEIELPGAGGSVDASGGSGGTGEAVDATGGAVEGVLLESGARFGGYVLYVEDGRPVYEYAFSERERVTIVGDAPLPPGRSTVRYEFKKTGPRRGTGTLLVDGRVVGTAELPKTWPTVGVTAGLRCGRGGPAPISDGYPAPFPFTGTVHRVVVELGDDGVHDLAAEYEGALADE